MFKLKKEIEITDELITKIIEIFTMNFLPRFQLLERYYRGDNQIKHRVKSDQKPNNKLSHNFSKYITNMATSFHQSKGIRYNVKDDDEYRKMLSEVLDRNCIKDVNFEIAKEVSKKGIAFEILYTDEEADVKFKKFTAEEIIPVYSSNMDEFLSFAIRLYDDIDIVNSKVDEYAEVYTKGEIIHFKKIGGKYTRYNIDYHVFEDVPVIIYKNNEEEKGDYEDIISLIDAYDKSQSDSANDFEYFTDAYLVLTGTNMITEALDNSDEENLKKFLRSMRDERVIIQEDSSGKANFLVKDINDTAIENYKNRVFKDIFFLSQIPSLTDENFSGNASGVSLKYKLQGLEELTAIKENKSSSAQRKKIKLITEFLNLKHSKNFDINNVEIKFSRGLIQNTEENAKIISLLGDVISQRTKLEQIDFVEDVEEELERLSEENGEVDKDTFNQLKSQLENSELDGEELDE